jgi:hypothetical protein
VTAQPASRTGPHRPSLHATTRGPWRPCGPTSQRPLSLHGPIFRDSLPPNPLPLLYVCQRPPANPSLPHPVPSPGAYRHCCSSCHLTYVCCSTDLSPPEPRRRLTPLCQPPTTMAAVPPRCLEPRAQRQAAQRCCSACAI